MTDDEKRLACAVDKWAREHREELVRDIIQLVNIKSVSEPGEGGYTMGTGCKKCADALMAMGEKYGFETENDEYYCTSIIEKGKSAAELGFFGHMDVVPEGDGWKYDPYDAFESQGFIVGRGSLDNKGPTLSTLYAMRCLKDLGCHLDHTIRMIAGYNEESGMKDVEHYLKTHNPPECTLVCDATWPLVIGEMGILSFNLTMKIEDKKLLELSGGTAANSVPAAAKALVKCGNTDKIDKLYSGRNDIQFLRKGDTVLVETKGKPAHTANPELGENAIYKLLDVLIASEIISEDTSEMLSRLRDCFCDNYGTGLGIAYEDEPSGKTKCVVSKIRLEDGVLTLTVNTRYAVTQDSGVMITNLKEVCAKKGLTLGEINNNPPFYVSEDDPVVRLLIDTCNDFLSDKLKPFVMSGGTYARKIPNAFPCGTYLPSPESPFGIGHGIHEAVCIDYLLDAIRMYVMLLTRLDRFFAI